MCMYLLYTPHTPHVISTHLPHVTSPSQPNVISHTLHVTLTHLTSSQHTLCPPRQPHNPVSPLHTPCIPAMHQFLSSICSQRLAHDNILVSFISVKEALLPSSVQIIPVKFPVFLIFTRLLCCVFVARKNFSKH